MDNNVDINEELRIKNQEILLNKRIIDLETAMESIIAFYSEYSTKTIADEINDQICILQGLDANSSKEKEIYNTITTFFYSAIVETKKTVTVGVESLKKRLNDISDQEYREELNQLSTLIVNQTLDYYTNQLEKLTADITITDDLKIREKIKKYLLNIMTVKMINILQSKLADYIMVIGNNYKENNKVIERINAKTLK